MKNFLIAVLFFGLCTPLASLASSAKELYQQGLGHYQSKNWEMAAEQWQKALALEPQNPLVLYNLGLAQFRLDKPGLALALWRKALWLNSSLSEARKASREAEKQLGLAERERFWLQQAAGTFQVSTWMLLGLVTFSLAGWLAVSFTARRRRALLDETSLPTFPYGLCAAAFFFVLFSTLASIKYFDQSRILGTIVSKGVVAKSSPSQQGTDLFKIPEGTEVVLEQVSKEWVQAFLPGGLSGWVKKDDLLQSSGSALW